MSRKLLIAYMTAGTPAEMKAAEMRIKKEQKNSWI